MSHPVPQKPFVRQSFVQGAEVVGAQWWQEGLERATDPSRRRAMIALAAAGGSIAAAGVIVALLSGSDEKETAVDSLDLQEKEGWDVGQPGGTLPFPGATMQDAENGRSWQAALTTLGRRLAPARIDLLAYHVPTLFQVLQSPSAAGLRGMITPVRSRAQDLAFARGRGILALFKALPKMPSDTAIIVDLPGPEAVALTAGLAAGFDPVFLFDNWPHPAGVVPAHLTIAAALYYLVVFDRAKRERPSPAPPVFVLDRNRLTPYIDADRQFDNRYMARLPNAEGFRKLGVQHLLYVTDNPFLRELDDLNADFVAVGAAGIDVKVLATGDLQEAPWSPGDPVGTRYYYGGSSHSHFIFWSAYMWHASAPTGRMTPTLRTVSNGASYKPAPRPTIFSTRTVGGARGIGKAKPSGFGRVSVRMSSSGRVTGVRAGRSGSFGRAGSGRSG
jgi:hypothetical protein